MELSTLNIKILLISDIWTTSVGGIFFISVIAHYIDNDWKLNKCIITFRSFDYPHSDQQIFNAIYQIAATYSISNKIMSVIFNNISNNNVATQLLKDSFHPILNEKLFHIRCALSYFESFCSSWNGHGSRYNYKN